MSKDHKITCALIAGIALFAFLPNTMFNWAFNYLQFIPWWGVAICLAASIAAAVFPERFCNGRTARIAAIAAAVTFPICLYVFRTRIHCFGGDMCVGTIPTDWSISWKNFIPPLPTVGRLDTYGSAVVTKLALRWDVPQHDRTTGEVSIRKWKLAKAAARSLLQTISLSFRIPASKRNA